MVNCCQLNVPGNNHFGTDAYVSCCMFWGALCLSVWIAADFSGHSVA